MVPSQIKHLVVVESQSLSIELTVKIFSKPRDSSSESDGGILLQS